MDFSRCCDPFVFRALADPSRLGILAWLLSQTDTKTVSEVCENTDVDQSVVSRHLATLHDAGLVTKNKDGRKTYYRAKPVGLATQLRSIAECLDHCICACSSACTPKGKANKQNQGENSE